jgi:hypothetical protein
MFALPFENTSLGKLKKSRQREEKKQKFSSRLLERKNKIRSLHSHLGRGSQQALEKSRDKFFEVM